MDGTQEYVKMCEKAEEIQALREFDKPFQDGDWWISKRCKDAVACAWRAYKGEDVWLPRQDQLQELTALGWVRALDRLGAWVNEGIDEWSFSNEGNKWGSMEQLWLAFVMKEKYNKVWSGTYWIEEERKCLNKV